MHTMKMNRFHLAVLLLSLMMVGSGVSQVVSAREKAIFQKGVRDYLQGNYDKAAKNFSLVISKLPNSSLLTANYLMLAKTQYKRGEYTTSLKTCQQFLEKFPDSHYRDDIYYLMANNYYQLNRPETAVTTWLKVAETSSESLLKQKALQLAENGIRYKLDTQSLSHLKQELKSAFARQVLLFNWAERSYASGNETQALAMLNEVKQIKSGSDEYPRKAKDLEDIIRHKKSGKIRIAALLPLSGPNGAIGKALLQGAQMAVSEYNQLNGKNIEIVEYDYKTHMTTALQKMKEIAAQSDIIAVYGPVENDITAACAVISDYEKIALITPTASSDALTGLSDYLVQLSLPVSEAGRQLARFVLDTVDIKRVATLTPIDDYFLTMTEAFVDECKLQGAEIAAQQWYYPGDQDFSRQFKALKRVGLKLAFQDSLLLLDSTLALTDIDSLYKVFLKKKQYKLNETHTKLDSADIPVTTFDAFFLPVYQDDINYIAPQFAYFNIQTQLLGNSDWYDLKALKKNKNYINGLIFVADGFLNEQSWDFMQFRNSFRNRFKSSPEQFEITGYDGFRFILSALPAGKQGVSRSRIVDYMTNTRAFKGIFKNITLGPKRYNESARILKFVYGQLLPLQ